jgi:hypothetical protein
VRKLSALNKTDGTNVEESFEEEAKYDHGFNESAIKGDLKV